MHPLTQYILCNVPLAVPADASPESLVPDDMRVFIVPEPKNEDELTMAAVLAELTEWLRLDPEARRQVLHPDLPEPLDEDEAVADPGRDDPDILSPGSRLSSSAPGPGPGSPAEELEALRPRLVRPFGRVLTREDWERMLQAVDKIILALQEKGDETATPSGCPAPPPPRPASPSAKIEPPQPRARRGLAERRQLTFTDWEKMRAAFDRGVSVQDLAWTLGVSRQTIYTWLDFSPERARRHFRS
ncbi:MAG: hypothetical protein LBQ16_06110 [Gracilibacteraceae bacterium]|jgi:hypothetical protein|nr:hypothetical protein [Gracilibacteraceae bacterium]